MGSLAALTLVGIRAYALEADSTWGEMGYADPITLQVEPLPVDAEAAASLSDAPTPREDRSLDTLEVTTVSASAETPKKSLPSISTIRNSSGVMTEERSPLRIYVAPIGGIASVVGNDTADVSPQYALGGSLGLLVSNNMLIEANYLYNQQDFSNPRINTTSGIILTGMGSAFTLKQSVFSGGAKLFVLGRESRIRPYLGGGIAYARGNLNYTSTYLQFLGGQSQYLTDFTLNQWDGYGELGAEIAITQKVVALMSFKLNGVLSSKTSNDSQTNLSIDPSKSDVGNSLSRSASYLLGAGVGIYF